MARRREPDNTQWTAADIAEAAVITTTDVLAALALIDEADRELGEMVRAEEFDDVLDSTKKEI